MSSNSEIISRFCALWAANIDLEAVVDCFTDDAVYVNVPIDPPNVGKDMIRATVEGFTAAASEIHFVVHHQTENADGVVMNERTDRFLIGDTWVELPVMGVFELSDGKISKWRDYFDMNQFMSQMPG
jgi:limonene-1,2-epoxide hydrolase